MARKDAEPHYNRMHRILFRLARRINPKLRCWYDVNYTVHDDANITCNMTCNICGINMNDPIIDHGIQHLKERNLLPFI